MLQSIEGKFQNLDILKSKFVKHKKTKVSLKKINHEINIRECEI